MTTKYTIISGTNRKGANSYLLGSIYRNLLAAKNIEADLIDLEKLPPDFLFTALYDNANKDEVFNSYQSLINNSDKFIFIIPEYNGSFPGVLKAFIDGLDYPSSFKHKKAALVGHSAGTQGSALALSHLTDIFNYLGMHVYAMKPRLLHIEKHLNKEGELSQNYLDLLREQVDGFVRF
ncbi:NADPH-dependent FMN reductase [bacterium]|nr:NADPH-dependent FMN reductase [bacterium]